MLFKGALVLILDGFNSGILLYFPKNLFFSAEYFCAKEDIHAYKSRGFVSFNIIINVAIHVYFTF